LLEEEKRKKNIFGALPPSMSLHWTSLVERPKLMSLTLTLLLGTEVPKGSGNDEILRFVVPVKDVLTCGYGVGHLGEH